MVTSKLTSKGQTTIPKPVREILRLCGGDELAYRIERSQVVLTKATRAKPDDSFATLDEWNSDNDRRAYRRL